MMAEKKQAPRTGRRPMTKAEVAARTDRQIAEMLARKGRPISYRGRRGIQNVGQDMPPLQDIPGCRVPEEVQGVNLVQWCDVQPPGPLRQARLLYHIANGGGRSKAEAGRLKAQGVRPGIPDYFLPVMRGGFGGLYIELKAEDGALSKEQRDVAAALSLTGYCVVVAWGYQAAIDAVTAYLSLPAHAGD